MIFCWANKSCCGTFTAMQKFMNKKRKKEKKKERKKERKKKRLNLVVFLLFCLYCTN